MGHRSATSHDEALAKELGASDRTRDGEGGGGVDGWRSSPEKARSTKKERWPELMEDDAAPVTGCSGASGAARNGGGDRGCCGAPNATAREP